MRSLVLEDSRRLAWHNVPDPERRHEREAIVLYGVLFDRLDDFEVADEFSTGSSYVCFWRADVGGRRIEGADFIRSNAQGKIASITYGRATRGRLFPIVGAAWLAGQARRA